VELEQMSVRQQIDLFANCKIAVGPHGAAFANMVWAGRDFNLIELHGGQVPEFFRNIANLKGQKWHEIEGHNVTADNPNKKFLDFTVDHNQVIDKIQSILNSL
jgi:capsular polysaccharide biosynthesis protein